MTALLRYQTGLLLRSQRWLAPLLLYAAFLGVGVNVGEPVLGALGLTSAALLPVTAWSVRICATQEPAAARNVVAAAAAGAAPISRRSSRGPPCPSSSGRSPSSRSRRPATGAESPRSPPRRRASWRRWPVP